MREIKFRTWDPILKNMNCGKTLDWYIKHYHGKEPYSDNIYWMQYTGLKDKNGTEIYEGDIVITSEAGVLTITWHEDGYWTWFGNYSINWEVIGNMYENPELLENI